MKKRVCMIVQNPMVKGGIAAVVNGYRGSELESDYEVIYVESYKDGGKITKLIKAVAGYFHFLGVLLFRSPDLIHMHSSFGPSFYRSLPFIYLATWFGKPVVNHIHGADFEEFYVNASDRKKRRIQNVYNKCKILIALSDEWKERLSLIVPDEKIRIIENYSILHEEAMSERLKRTCNHTVLFLGELGHRKGCYDIPAVAEAVLQKVPEAKVVLGGAGSAEDENAIRALFEEKCIADSIKFPGWVRGTLKDKLLKEADVFFLPSYNEGMPMSVLDAMGYGLPIVSTKVGGIPKIVRENGVCCTPGDVNTMAVAIIEMLQDTNKREMRAKASIEIVKAGYSLEAHLKMIEKVYEEALK